jgi:hypothetical protein
VFIDERSIGTSSALIKIKSSFLIDAMDFLWDSKHPETSSHRHPGQRDGRR